MASMKSGEIFLILRDKKFRSAWERGVQELALRRLYTVPAETVVDDPVKFILSGASDFHRLARGAGWVPFTEEEIVRLLCTPAYAKKLIMEDGLVKKSKNENPDYWFTALETALKNAAHMIATTMEEKEQ